MHVPNEDADSWLMSVDHLLDAVICKQNHMQPNNVLFTIRVYVPIPINFAYKRCVVVCCCLHQYSQERGADECKGTKKQTKKTSVPMHMKGLEIQVLYILFAY